MFFAVVTAIVVVVHAYLWWRLVRSPRWGRRTTVALTVVLVVLAVLVPLTLRLGRLDPRGPSMLLNWPGYLWMGAHFLLFVGLVVAEVPRAGSALARAMKGAPADPSRRQLFSRVAAGAAAGVAVPVTVAGIASATSIPEVVHVRIPLRRLPAAFDGFRIALITDLHVGPTIARGFVEDVVARTNAAGADLIALGGDFVDGSVEDLASDIVPLRELRAPHGVCFVTGNHEYYSGVEEWTAWFRESGIRVLMNERFAIERGGAAIDVAGVEDWSGRPNLKRALAGRDAGRCVVLLAHQPKHVFQARDQGVDLQLSGHTHGGQIFPFGAFTQLAQPVLAGLEKFGETWIYVSRGTGYWGPPMRVACPPEITVVELIRAV